LDSGWLIWLCLTLASEISSSLLKSVIYCGAIKIQKRFSDPSPVIRLLEFLSISLGQETQALQRLVASRSVSSSTVPDIDILIWPELANPVGKNDL
jgi:hypothetical protein